MNIQQLKSLWGSEKEAFKGKELGALQNFVKKVLECVELFNLEEGKESTAPHDRRNVFIQEDTDSKARNRPDFVLYLEIDQTQIKIPVEVEKHENIKAGEKQIKDYKEIYNAVYSILTDGYEWRFYDGDTVHKILRLDEILDEPEIFQTFWNEYTLPETYYISFFERMGSKSLFDKEGLEVEENRETFFDDITKLIRDFKYKLRLSHYFIKEKYPDKVATEISYAYVIQYILYKTLVDDIYSNKREEFQGRFKEVLKSLKGNVFGEVLTQATHIADYISENLYRPFSAEQRYIEERLNEIRRQTKKSISDISAWLDIFIFIKKYNFASVKNELFGYIYENYLKELYEDKNKGQYFTDPAVVEFMLDEIGYTTAEIKKRIKDKPDNPDISIIDPACGSGTFLYSAAKRIIDAVYRGDEKTAKQAETLISENVFGLDIAVFPLYLAEMGILMKMLPLIVSEKYNNPMDKKIKLFKTDDSIAEFVDMMHTISEKGGQKELFVGHKLEVSKFMRNEEDLAEMKGSMRPPRRRFDFVIGNPPYIGLNACYKENIPFAVLMRHLNSDGTANKNKKLYMNDVYGVNLHSVPGYPKKGRPNPNLYAFFIALGLSLLKDNGKLSFIIPQTILIDSDYDVLRYHLSKFPIMQSMIMFEGKMFIGRGLKQTKPVPTSSLIFVVQHKIPLDNNKVQIRNYRQQTQGETFEELLNGKNCKSATFLQADLLKHFKNWNHITKDKKVIDILQNYTENSNSLSEYYTHIEADAIYKSRFYFDGGYGIDERLLLNVKSDYMYPKVNNQYYTLKDIRGFWPNMRNKKDIYFIKLRQATQGYGLLDSPYKIVWSYAATKRFFFTDKKVIWARNQFEAIGSNNKKELLYLFGILNSSISWFLIYNILKNENEETLTVALSLKSVKSEFRIPKITKENQFIKDEVIKCAEEMLDLEDCQLQDLIDFSNITKQKFESIEVKGNNLVLTQNREEYKVPIKSKKDVVNAVLKEQYGDKSLLPIEIALSELKYLLALDKELQKSLKDYIDDLVFALYFNIPVKKIGLNLASQIKELCRQNEFYDYVEKEMLND
jgi:hypothetical protein